MAADADPADRTPLPTLQEIAVNAPPALFPVDLLHGAHSAISFYSAAFYGRNDVIHLHRAGIREIALNDLDGEKLAYMRSLYPACNELFVDDAVATALRLAVEKRVFDIVVCDPFTSLTALMATGLFDVFRRLAARWYIFGLTGDDIATIGGEPTPEGLGRALRGLHGEAVSVAALVLRNPHPVQRGVYWGAVAGSGAG
jgi:hypothetical protein